MKIIHTDFGGVHLLEPKVFEDARGYFVESYNHKVFHDLGIRDQFIQDNQSLSLNPGVVRGLHYQKQPKGQSKLIRVLQGALFDVVVDIRRNSPTFGKWAGYILSEHNKRQLYIPKGFAHGFCTLVPHTQIAYKVDEFYSPEHDRGVHWNDPDIGIQWPVTQAILSEKDKNLPLLKYAEIDF